MIKIIRTPRPAELTDETIRELTQEFKKDSSRPVWRKSYLSEALRDMSNAKCCFCEMKLIEEGKHLNIEHYHPKSKYPDEVVQWDNLLPSCNRCNSNKHTHDTYVVPIIDPTKVDPKDSLYFRNYRLFPKDGLGKATIDILCLNDTHELCLPRYKIGNAIQEKLGDLHEIIVSCDIENPRDTKKLNRVRTGIRQLLSEANPQSEYSALAATVILNDTNYHIIKSTLCESKFWSTELDMLERGATEIALV